MIPRWVALLVLACALRAAADPIVDRALAALGPLPSDHRLSPLNHPQDTDLGPGPWAWSATVVADLRSLTPRVKVCAQKDGNQRVWTVAFRNEWEPLCLVANSNLVGGQAVGASNFHLERRVMLPGQPGLTDAQALQGQRLRHALKPGDPLRPQDLELMPVIEMGTDVSVISLAQGLCLRQRAKALEPGYPGRPFRVRTDEGRLLTVTVDPRQPGSVLLSIPDTLEGPRP